MGPGRRKDLTSKGRESLGKLLGGQLCAVSFSLSEARERNHRKVLRSQLASAARMFFLSKPFLNKSLLSKSLLSRPLFSDQIVLQDLV